MKPVWHAASVLHRSTSLFSHIKERWEQRSCSSTFCLQVYTPKCTWHVDVCLGGNSPNSTFFFLRSFLCLSLHLHLIQRFLSFFRCFRQQSGVNNQNVQVCVCVFMCEWIERCFLPPPHYPPFHPFAPSQKPKPKSSSLPQLCFFPQVNSPPPSLLCLSSTTTPPPHSLPACCCFPREVNLLSAGSMNSTGLELRPTHLPDIAHVLCITPACRISQALFLLLLGCTPATTPSIQKPYLIMSLMMLWMCRFKAQLINSREFIFMSWICVSQVTCISFLLLLSWKRWCVKLLINTYSHLHSAHIFSFTFFFVRTRHQHIVYVHLEIAVRAAHVRGCSTEISICCRRCHHSSYVAPGNSVMARCLFPKHWNLFTMQWAAASSSQCFSSMPQLQ